MKKKFMAMTLGLVMALSLVACGGGNDSSSCRERREYKC